MARYWKDIGKDQMATFKYYLANNKKKQSSLVLYCRWNNNLLKLSPEISIPSKLWNAAEQKIKTDPSNNRAHSQNDQLAKFRNSAEDTLIELKRYLGQIPTMEQYRRAMVQPPTDSGEPSTTFFGFTTTLIQSIEIQLAAEGKPLNKNTAASTYRQTLKVLREFLGTKVEKLEFSDLTMEFYNRFLSYCINAKDYSTNNIGKHIKNIKAIMNKALDAGLHNNLVYKRFTKVTMEVESIFLSVEELQSLLLLEFEESEKHLEITRDLFYIASKTGLRFSDWKQFGEKDLSGDKVTIITQKTGSTIVVPISKSVKGILEKYSYSLPKPKENQVMNRDLKELGLRAGIDNPVSLKRMKGGRTIVEQRPKYELITTHTARRSFATNLFKVGAKPIDIMKVTGHKTETAFMKYIKTSHEESADRLLEMLD